MEDYIGRSVLHRRRRRPISAPALGAGIAFGLITVGIALGGNFLSFIDIPSVLIVFGGTIGGTLLTYSVDELRGTIPAVKESITPRPGRIDRRLEELVELSQRVKTDGPMSLEQYTYRGRDPFMKRGLMLLIDNFSEEEFRKSLDFEHRNADDQYRVSADVLATAGAIAPAMGLIGTIIGLVHMLHQLNSPDLIGPGMATALITTLYGAVLSFLVFTPLSDKLRLRAAEEARLREMTYEALLLIHQNLHPRLIEQRLSSFAAEKASSNARL